MKLRCTTNSIRIRIRKSELAQLKQDKRVEEKIHFANHIVLTFALLIDESVQQVGATFLQHNLEVHLPKAEAQQWIDSNQVGIEVNHPISETQQLHILIEKDFPCLDRAEEDKSDTFWELAPEEPDAC